MAFKMAGYSPFTKKPEPALYKKDETKELLESEHKDTKITGGSKLEEQNDIEQRMEFIEEDIFNQDGKMTPTQRADLATLDQKLRKLKNEKKK